MLCPIAHNSSFFQLSLYVVAPNFHLKLWDCMYLIWLSIVYISIPPETLIHQYVALILTPHMSLSFFRSHFISDWKNCIIVLTSRVHRFINRFTIAKTACQVLLHTYWKLPPIFSLLVFTPFITLPKYIFCLTTPRNLQLNLTTSSC